MTDANSNSSGWDIWVDTGGTFTDCLARSPGGRIYRTKVLSTAALRGSVLDQSDSVTLRIDARWDGSAHLVHGFRFRRVGEPEFTSTVVAYDRDSGALRLAEPISGWPCPFAFELQSPEEAPVLAARIVTGTGFGESLPPIRMRLATTRGTNALLERKGCRLVLFTTRGFGDVLRIGTQERPELFTLTIERPNPLHDDVVELSGRIAADGSELEPLDEAEVRAVADQAVAAGFRVAAVSLMHAYRNDAHEKRVERLLLEAGFEHVSRSSALAPSIGYYDRSQTTVVNAYLQPSVSGYVDRVQDALPSSGGGPDSSLHLMTSSGGLVRSRTYMPKDSLLSGPAGGVVGAAGSAKLIGHDRVVTFDMGGTSTDVARFDRDFDYVWRHRVGDVRLLAPALAIESVAAGGGSICAYGEAGLTVGPESAGAMPGPAGYGAGGPLTITDCNLLLGRIDSGGFGVPIDPAAAGAALDAILDKIQISAPRPTPESLAAGLIDIANERMADAIRAVSLRQGYDPADYALVVFGGAGAQHGCGIADRLGMRKQIIPPDAGVLSAWGLGQARIERFAESQLLRTLDGGATVEQLPWLRDALSHLDREAIAAVGREGVASARVGVRRRIANARLVGQDATIGLDLQPGLNLDSAFRDEYQRVFGHRPEGRDIEIESLRVIASEERSPHGDMMSRFSTGRTSAGERRVWLGGEWCMIPCFPRDQLSTGDRIEGPCLIVEPFTTVLVEPGWRGRLGSSGAIVLEARATDGPLPARFAATDGVEQPDQVREQLFTSRFEGIVGEMGEQLRRTALSTNVKERLDFSCALLDAGGELIANAPHIPVHLGALGLCVRALIEKLPLQPGDVGVTNHPAFGGSHLPDLTVVTPVYTGDGLLIGYVANRAHHAEIGGTRPGSMPPAATTLEEEGIVIPPSLLLEGGSARWEEVANLLTSGPFPSRNPNDNLADLRAQVAANHRGATLLRNLAAVVGVEVVGAQMRSLTARSERQVRSALRRFPNGNYAATERLDDGSALTVSVSIGDDEATFDFSGTAAQHPGNLNATPAIVSSAVIYVLRLLLDEPLPLNEGLLRPVHLLLPPSLLNPDFTGPPTRCPAVVGGNTEISQRLVDTILKALQLAACSQGTMNNVLWGTPSFGYYETLAGGEGASRDHHGASAVHTHMTNTRITDAEVLEHRYPVRVERFEFRRGSGGKGLWNGGDGVIREYTFLEPMAVSVLTQHRREAPYGAAGGMPGAVGGQWIVRADGVMLPLSSVDGADVSAGDRLVVETPGGGGWGAPERRDTARNSA